MNAGRGQGLYSAGMSDLERMAAFLKDESTPLRGALTDARDPLAIGLRCSAVADADAVGNQATIETLARQHGYTLASTYVSAPQTVPLVVIASVLEMVHVARAGAVIVPGMAHLGGSVPVEFTRVCSVIMPGHVMLGRTLYPPPPTSGDNTDAEAQR